MTDSAEAKLIEPTHEEPRLPGHETELNPKPDWEPRYPGSGRLAGKVAIVTGADSGIGRAVAVLYAREGARVAVAYLCENDDAHITADAIEQEGSEVLLFAGDLGDPDTAKRLVEETIDKWGRLDVLVNNAGEQHYDKDIRNITEEQLKRTFQTNVFGMFYLTQAAVSHLKEGSAIINCTSETMYAGSAGLLDYSATKGAITAFTRSLAKNVVKKGIRVNGVAPGPIWTPLNPFGGQPPEKVPEFGKDTPMGRPGQPNEVAPSFLFLACEDSSYMTGQILHPDGGDTTSS